MRARLIEDHTFLEKKKRYEEATSDIFTQITREADKISGSWNHIYRRRF